ncbi:MAG TPA: c-type cytochrome, partial [Gemmataceae bacterium]|nr:c-type cytochrome [Gemmataceae bacterium]
RTAVEPLRKLARESKSPLARLHALWTLDGLAALEDDLVERALRDAEPGLREHGLRLAEPRLAKSAALREAVLRLADDDEPRVRFQAAFTLGELADDRALDALARIAVRDSADRWVRIAVLSSVPESGGKLLARLHAEYRDFLDKPGNGAVAFIRQLTAMVGERRHSEEMMAVLRLVTANAGDRPSRWQLAALAGLGETLRRSRGSMAPWLRDAEVAARLKVWAARAVEIAAATDRDLAERLDALTLLALLPSEAEAARLKELLRPQQPQQVQAAAVRVLAALPGREAVAGLLADWDTRTAPLRREILSALLARADRAGLLLDALERGEVRLSELDAARRDQLLRYPDKAISERAKKLFETEKPTSQQKVVAEWTPKVLALTGDAVRGQQVYAAHCASCHRLHGQGVAVGPDLATVSSRAKEALLVDILDPNRAIDPAYVDYVLVTQNGQVVNGIIAAETATSVTLRRAERQETTVLRKDIAEMRSTGVSLMPEGVEKSLTPQDLADLLELLRRERLH